MSAEPAPRLDRRHLRRAATITQIVDVALEVMGEQGVAGLSLGEVARRVGIRPPSLYVYFASKNAVYDAVFARGWQEVLSVMEALPLPEAATDIRPHLLQHAEAFVRWSVEHPVHTQLMGWRPVPNYEPSAEAYASAVATVERGRMPFVRLVELGLLRADVPVDELFKVWTVLISGVISQQLANAPTESFARGSFTTLLPALVDMYCTHYETPSPGRPRTTARKAPRKSSQ